MCIRDSVVGERVDLSPAALGRDFPDDSQTLKLLQLDPDSVTGGLTAPALQLPCDLTHVGLPQIEENLYNLPRYRVVLYLRDDDVYA